MVGISNQLAAALTGATIVLTGCYVVPLAPDGTPVYSYPYPVSPHAAVAPAPVLGPVPTVLQARLYPANDIASQTGMFAGTVTNLMTGKGRFQMEYQGELLSGEATRVPGNERRGVASAYGSRGTYMTCEYRMTSAYQGAGVCTMSTGARYQVHLGG